MLYKIPYNDDEYMNFCFQNIVKWDKERRFEAKNPKKYFRKWTFLDANPSKISHLARFDSNDSGLGIYQFSFDRRI